MTYIYVIDHFEGVCRGRIYTSVTLKGFIESHNVAFSKQAQLFRSKEILASNLAFFYLLAAVSAGEEFHYFSLTCLACLATHS